MPTTVGTDLSNLQIYIKIIIVWTIPRQFFSSRSKNSVLHNHLLIRIEETLTTFYTKKNGEHPEKIFTILDTQFCTLEFLLFKVEFIAPP